MCRDDIVSTKWSFSKVRVWNHQDKCSMKKLRQHDEMAASCTFQVVEDDWKLFCDVYIILCHVSDPNLGGAGADCLHPKWAVVPSCSWNIHCFQIRWRICHSVVIGIKGSLHNRVNAAMNLLSIVTSCSRRQTYSNYMFHVRWSDHTVLTLFS